MSETNVMQQLEDLLSGRMPTPAQFARIVKVLAQHIKRGQEKNEKTLEAIQKALETLRKQIKADNDNALEGMKGQVDTLFVENRLRELEKQVHVFISGASEHVATLQKGKDGLEGPPGPPGEPGIDGSPDTPQQIVTKLESLQGSDRLHVSAIDGLEDLLKKSGGGKTVLVPSGSASGGNSVQYYDLSSSLDGSTKVFSLPAFHRIISVHLSSFPTIMRPTTDFTVDPNAYQITFTDEIDAETSLSNGQTLIIVYAA
jgi:hypothetical protein